MFKKVIYKLMFSVVSFAICFATVFAVDALATDSVDNTLSCASVQTKNTGVTSCWWFNTCNHKSHYYTWPKYQTTSYGTEYKYLGRYVEAGDSATISESVTYSSDISGGLEFGFEKAKISLGVSGSLSKTYSFSQTVNNRTKSRKYVHAGVEYGNRKNKITHKYRTYNPNNDVTGWNKTCKYKTEYANPKGKIQTGCGYSLLSKKKYNF